MNACNFSLSKSSHAVLRPLVTAVGLSIISKVEGNHRKVIYSKIVSESEIYIKPKLKYNAEYLFLLCTIKWWFNSNWRYWSHFDFSFWFLFTLQFCIRSHRWIAGVVAASRCGIYHELIWSWYMNIRLYINVPIYMHDYTCIGCIW